jgi:U32 family peptidase
MQFNTYVASLGAIDQAAQASAITEVLIEPSRLARQGALTDAGVQALAIAAQQKHLNPVLVWDVLMGQTQLEATIATLQDWDLSQFSAIRVCDLGIAQWLKQAHPNIPMQLIVEAGSHNQPALEGWCEFFGPQLERLILSVELPEAKLIDYCQQLPVACEILGVGPILLFYSPRSLLAPHLNSEPDSGIITASITTADLGNRRFPTQETPHGTFMFLDKDQFILDRLGALESAGLAWIRLDLRHLDPGEYNASNLATLVELAQRDPAQLRQQWPRPTQSPFFTANRTTAVFPRIKSKTAHLRTQNCIAECIGTEKGAFSLFHTLRAADLTQVDRFILPTGKVIEMPADLEFHTLSGVPISTCGEDQLIYTPWLRQVCTGTLMMSTSV